MDNEKYNLIEKRILELVGSYQKMKDERNRLAALISEKDSLIQSLNGELERMREERVQARDRVDNLLSKLDEINLDEMITG